MGDGPNALEKIITDLQRISDMLGKLQGLEAAQQVVDQCRKDIVELTEQGLGATHGEQQPETTAPKTP